MLLKTRTVLASVAIAILASSVEGSDMRVPTEAEVRQAVTLTPPLNPKYPAQDGRWNTKVPAIELVRRHEKAVIPLLIEVIASEEAVRDAPVLDFWGETRAGDVAFVLLLDLFIDPSTLRPTAPGMTWEEIVGRPARDDTAWARYRRYLEEQGRESLRDRWRSFWTSNRDAVRWDSSCPCFRASGEITPFPPP